ncbi:MAG: glycosyltransferase family 39 protein [Candidatus Hinthialibacter antarcticus]|nr:glycosyltransferase family 39 protein [Candidatus Hinthialibacter antarcticus]
MNDNPSGFFRDEASKGYTSYCLMKTGQDMSATPWPLFVKEHERTTSSLYQYITIPFIYCFGLTEAGVRLPACLAGTLSVLIGYWIARRWWGSRAGLWAAAFVCLSPWSLLLSRWANQSILLTLWVPLAVYFLFKKEKPTVLDAVLSALCLLLALYTYATARLTAPVLVVVFLLVLLLFAKDKRALLVPTLCFVFVFFIGAIPMAMHLISQPEASGSRLSDISIFDGQPLLSLMLEFILNYASHLSPGFLFINGDANLRHNTLAFGQVHWYIAPLLVAGFVQAIWRRNRIDVLLLVWFFCFPLAAACTRESIPHGLRSVYAVPVIHLMAVNGLLALKGWREYFSLHISPKLVRTLVIIWGVVFVLFPAIYLYDLFVRYPVYSAPDWEYGYRDAINWWEENWLPQKRVVVTGIAQNPDIFFLFYSGYIPARYFPDGNIDRVEFLPLGQSVNSTYTFQGEATMYLTRPFELPSSQPEKVILLPNGEPVWKWVRGGEQ